MLPLAAAVLDVCCIMAAYLFAVFSTALTDQIARYSLVNHAPYLAIFVLVWFGAALDLQLWGARRTESIGHYLVAIIKAVADAAVISVFVMVLFTPEGLDRGFLVTFCCATLACLSAFRVIGRFAAWQVRSLGYNQRRAVLLGANERAARLAAGIRTRRRYGYILEGVLDDDPERMALLGESDLAYLGGVDALQEVLAEKEIDEVFVSLPVRSYYETIRNVTELCEKKGVPVHLPADLFPVRIATSSATHIEDIPLISLSPVPEARINLALKRASDFVLSTMLILAFSPLLLAIAILIKLDSKGPILFFQERVGQNQRRFKMLKFRSMVVDAEALRRSLEQLNELDGPVFKIRHDPRITRVGRYLRRFSLDELPQLFNVWWGQMSLVGPRPPIPSEVEQYTWTQRRRLSVKPGMTGRWQVSGRNEVGFEEWVEMDLGYIDSWSLAQDFLILLKTFNAVISRRGAS